MEYEYGYTIDELIVELQNLKLNLGTGDVEVMLVELLSDDETEVNCHISTIETNETESGETIVRIF